MTITMNHRAFSALAKVDTTDLKHAERLQAFGKALGFDSGAALMSTAREDGTHVLMSKNPDISADAEQVYAAEKEEVTVKLWTHDFAHDMESRGTSWLQRLTPSQFLFLAECGFTGKGTRSFFLSNQDHGVKSLEYYLTSPLNTDGPSAYTIQLDPTEVLRWTFKNRHDLYETLLSIHEKHYSLSVHLDKPSNEHQVLMTLKFPRPEDDIKGMAGRYRVKVRSDRMISLLDAEKAATDTLLECVKKITYNDLIYCTVKTAPIPDGYLTEDVQYMDNIFIKNGAD